MAAEFVTRPARREDLPAVVAAEHDIYTLEGPWTLEEYLDAFHDPATLCMIVEHGTSGALAGYGLAHIEHDVVDIQAVTAVPKFRRLGLGRLLLREMLAWAARHGAGAATLYVREGNAAALDLYLSEGFSVIDRLVNFYDDGVHALYMGSEVAGAHLLDQVPTPRYGPVVPPVEP